MAASRKLTSRPADRAEGGSAGGNIADLGIQGDVHKVMPKLIEALKAPQS